MAACWTERKSRPARVPARPVMIGTSSSMQILRTRIAEVARTAETVLIAGESGTGKELVARAIHAASSRSAAPLVSLNCPVLSAHLMESELFGHERGAFTGAESPRTGRFELADGGTILLDEITEIELPLQAKLLRVLQKRWFDASAPARRKTSMSGYWPRRTAVFATKWPPENSARIYTIAWPCCRSRFRRCATLGRRAAIGQLFFRRAAKRLQRSPCEMEPAAMQLLVEYHWPGNVRELENIVTRAACSIWACRLKPTNCAIG